MFAHNRIVPEEHSLATGVHNGPQCTDRVAPPCRASLCVKREGGREGGGDGVPEKASKVVTPGINRFYQICVSTITRSTSDRDRYCKNLFPLGSFPPLGWNGTVAIASRGVGTGGASRFSRNLSLQGRGLDERREKILERRRNRGNKKSVRERLLQYLFEERWCGLPSPRFFFVFPVQS